MNEQVAVVLRNQFPGRRPGSAPGNPTSRKKKAGDALDGQIWTEMPSTRT